MSRPFSLNDRRSLYPWLGPVLLIAAACGSAPAERNHGGTVAESHEDQQMDSSRANRVPVVLRVRFEKLLGGQKYAWDEVTVLATLKNQSGRNFSGRMEIAHYDWEPGIPAGESTVYLVTYAEGDESRWKLLDGTAKEGVSHTAAAK